VVAQTPCATVPSSVPPAGIISRYIGHQTSRDVADEVIALIRLAGPGAQHVMPAVGTEPKILAPGTFTLLRSFTLALLRPGKKKEAENVRPPSEQACLNFRQKISFRPN
jgi:hypothetical protein